MTATTEELSDDTLPDDSGVSQLPTPATLARYGRMTASVIIGISGVFVNTAALWLFLQAPRVNGMLWLAALAATLMSSVWNYVLNRLLVFRRRTPRYSELGTFAFYLAVNSTFLILRLPILKVLTAVGMHLLVANVISLGLLFFMRFNVLDQYLFVDPNRVKSEPLEVITAGYNPKIAYPLHYLVRRQRKQPKLMYYYKIVFGDKSIGIASVVPLPELATSLSTPFKKADITIVRGVLGSRWPRLRMSALIDQKNGLFSYYEQLAGSRFIVQTDKHNRHTVTVGWLLAHSPHVVYTNIVEGLLRYHVALRGGMLLHSATVATENGEGVQFSALTDTGKTTTILQLLRRMIGLSFLSDDMTIVMPDGNAYSYTKPLTISRHTVRAVDAKRLTHRQWWWLAVQSRLHSKQGRLIGMILAKLRIPIMGLNAFVQMLVPPPKFHVQTLVDTKLTPSVRVNRLYLIVRGPEATREMDLADTLTRLLINTADAYGFPPFTEMRQAVNLGGMNCTALEELERGVLAEYLEHIQVLELSDPAYGWGRRVEAMLSGEPAVAGQHRAPELNPLPQTA